jgi:hypothetical protein
LGEQPSICISREIKIFSLFTRRRENPPAVTLDVLNDTVDELKIT